MERPIADLRRCRTIARGKRLYGAHNRSSPQFTVTEPLCLGIYSVVPEPGPSNYADLRRLVLQLRFRSTIMSKPLDFSPIRLYGSMAAIIGTIHKRAQDRVSGVRRDRRPERRRHERNHHERNHQDGEKSQT
jgi:hypothetical protein